jgi:hypothetical protein
MLHRLDIFIRVADAFERAAKMEQKMPEFWGKVAKAQLPEPCGSNTQVRASLCTLRIV